MSERRTDKMSLMLFIFYSGAHLAAWRHPDAPDTDMHSFDYYKDLTLRAEAAKFDGVFLGDTQGLREMEGRDAFSRLEPAKLEPLTLLSALAPVTTRIGLAGTVSTSYNHPYTVARKFSSLDHISGGRAGWNVVTSSHEPEARNFGRDENFEHAERYERAHEFMEICEGLWDSWDDDAVVRDRASGRYFDPDKVHGLNFEGRFFKVEGPLNLFRSPQGHPVIFQAGSSGDGQRFAAQYADVVFTSQPTLEAAQAFYTSVKDLAESLGRDRRYVKVAPAGQPLIGSTEAEVARKTQELTDLMHPDVAIAQMQAMLGGDSVRLSDYPPDGPLPPMSQTRGNQTFQAHVIKMASEGDLTIAETAKRLAASRFSSAFYGTPEQVADKMESWFLNHGADGFTLTPAMQPSGLHDFADQVVPILQKRGLFREDYEGVTFRDHLGLPRPASRHEGHPELHQEPSVWGRYAAKPKI